MKLNLSQASNFEIVQFLVLLEPTKGSLDRSALVVQQLPPLGRTWHRTVTPVLITDLQSDYLPIVPIPTKTQFISRSLRTPPFGRAMTMIVTNKLHWCPIIAIRRANLVASLIPRLGGFFGARSHQDDRDSIEFLNNGFVNALGIISPVGQNVLGSEVPEILSRIFQEWDALWPVMPFRCRNFEPHGDVCICIGDQMAFVSEPPLLMTISSLLGRPRSIGITLSFPRSIAISVHDGAVNCDGTPKARDYFTQVGNQCGHALHDKFPIGQEFLPKSAERPRRGDFIGMENAAQVGKQRVISQPSDEASISRDVQNEARKDSLDHDRNGIARSACSAGSFQILNQAKNLRVVKDHAQAFGKIAVLPFAKRSTIDSLCYDTTS